ncbi:hypothetical protein [Aliikangiella coralliicola]|uniref:Uncharacterized protein n=1 Tax=Aliikangiella coralliicola TaxID=2592383 RepID=A0A545UIK1_9GAMM|nr:hypothetical protein [Aliikangiella coralliicola]TQV89285.1 hypothetical protein FLL46_03905 [Aliikangiella coralliicola]
MKYLIFRNRMFDQIKTNGVLEVLPLENGSFRIFFDIDGSTNVPDVVDCEGLDDLENTSYRHISADFDITLPYEVGMEKGLDYFRNWQFSPYKQEKKLFESYLRDEVIRDAFRIMYYDDAHEMPMFNLIRVLENESGQCFLYWECYGLEESEYKEIVVDDSDSWLCREPLFIIHWPIEIKFKQKT